MAQLVMPMFSTGFKTGGLGLAGGNDKFRLTLLENNKLRLQVLVVQFSVKISILILLVLLPIHCVALCVLCLVASSAMRITIISSHFPAPIRASRILSKTLQFIALLKLLTCNISLVIDFFILFFFHFLLLDLDRFEGSIAIISFFTRFYPCFHYFFSLVQTLNFLVQLLYYN